MNTIAQEIEKHKGERTLPDITLFNSQYEVKKHKIFTDLVKYPDRTVVSDYTDEKGNKQQQKVTIPLNRIGLPYQKKIVNIATTFLCGEPIKYTNNLEDDKLFKAFLKVIEKNKMKFVDREIATSVGRFTECAELWYFTDEPNEHYGFESKYRLKVKVLTPDIYSLYPKFDENDNLISFAREFKNGNKTIFEVYTDKRIIRYEQEKEWKKISDIPNAIKKIPIVYYKQENVEWADVQTAIERLEHIYSNTAESNDRFSFPILKLKGKVTGQLSQDKSGRVLQLEEGAEAEFANQPQANQSLTEETDRLERDVHDFTATPNISFDNMKGLGNMLAGSNAEFLFLSAHLKVMDKLAIYIPALQRRASIIKSHLQMFNVKLKNDDLDVEPIITPFIINNEAEFVRFLMEANGNKPVYSLEHSMQKLGIKNPKEMMLQIQEENDRINELANSKSFAI
ncbi:phage portal protein [Riemerella anatipestifer]|uniref:phage portal protein n=1 Tax=Riemerella anatipestifer TaxID=34085 RepID=UPI001BDAC2A6|nr:phage portal protein [Riemerella anatipestifer]MBT0554269.1 phage portal protein [Riemerella anatipestifer]MCE3024994.1 phage portal protein [Riemerella anatipestifer]MDY3449817.1 phage portal protein [Riemerella anatipestifer]QYR03362.1 phage portal protein [Riemerella anatipestifer]QYR05631.1 phage portal protein [Riemerella anatipestifer]